MLSTLREVTRTLDSGFGGGALATSPRERTPFVRSDRSAFYEELSVDDPLKGLPGAPREMERSHRIRVLAREGSRPFAHHAAPNRSSRSWRMPPANPVSATARDMTKRATTADVALASEAPDDHAPTDIVANTAPRMTADFPYAGEIRKRSSCFPGACSSTASNSRLPPSGPPRTSKSQESNSPPARAIAPASTRSSWSFVKVSSGASRWSRQ